MIANPEATRAVVTAGHTARMALARDLAQAFQANPAGFDPKLMERLGTEGLAGFLAVIGNMQRESASQIRLNQEVHAGAQPTDGNIGRAPSGWAHLRRPERSPWIVGTSRGFTVGVVIVCIGSFYLSLIG